MNEQIFLTSILAVIFLPLMAWLHWSIALSWFAAVIVAIVYGMKLIWNI